MVLDNVRLLICIRCSELRLDRQEGGKKRQTSVDRTGASIGAKAEQCMQIEVHGSQSETLLVGKSLAPFNC